MKYEGIMDVGMCLLPIVTPVKGPEDELWPTDRD